MVPSINVMRMASRAMTTFSACANFVGSMAGAESAFHTAAAAGSAGVCAAVQIGARATAIARSVLLESMVGPTGWQEGIVLLSKRQVTSRLQLRRDTDRGGAAEEQRNGADCVSLGGR